MRFQAITSCTALLLSFTIGAPIVSSMDGGYVIQIADANEAKRAEAIYGNPETATLPYNVNSLNMVERRKGEAIYGNPETATLPYNVNSLRVAERRGLAAYGQDSLSPSVQE
ncbi:uncharacterized protein PG998_007595 [Apiospora kogelbergensis]|uniref:Uncharacterized protein n=1 Tax=Apiospora kogelbergensis TaxID=1337665 RepID=A0AAW0QP62_9PEZI